MTLEIIEAIVATSHPLAAYDGVRFPKETLETFAAAIREGTIPMLWNHDIRRPASSKVLDAQVRPTDDGYEAVWIRFEVDATQWSEYNQQLKDVGAPGGFSFSCTEPVEDLAGVMALEGMGDFDLAADAFHWSDETLLNAAEDLRSVGTVKAARRYEFALEPAAVVSLGFVLTDVALPIFTGVLSSAIFLALTRFLRPNRPTTFHFEIGRPGNMVKAHLETSDPEVVKAAVESFDRLAGQSGLSEWDEDEGWIESD